jgi:competence protein ComEC
MTSPWMLALAGGVTIGALFGVPGVVMWTAGVTIAALPGRRSWLALAIVAAVGAGLGSMRVALDEVAAVPAAVLESGRAEVVVRSVPQSGPSGPRAVVRVESVLTEDSTWVPAGGDVLVLFRDHAPDDLARGDRLNLVWAVTSVEDGDAGWTRFVRSAGAGGSADVFSASVVARGESLTAPVVKLRELVTRRISEAIPGDGGALLAGFVTGDDSGLSDSAQLAFERTGMSHITAVSGSNVAVLLTMWFFVIRPGRMRRSIIALLGVSLLVWLYVLLVGMGPGAVRAGLFATLVLPAARLGRRPDPLTALMIASAMMLLIHPQFAHNIGFWLSLAASTAIVTCVDRRAKTRATFLMSGVVALCAAQVATLPIVVWAFGTWSPASIVANLIIGPVVSAFFPFAFVIAFVVSVVPWLGNLVGWLPSIVTEVILAVVESVGNGATMLRLGVATPLGIAMVAGLSLAVIAALSGDMRRWLTGLAWRAPGIERYATAGALGVGLGVWLAVVVRSLTG